MLHLELCERTSCVVLSVEEPTELSYTYENSGFHGDGYEDRCLLGCCVMLSEVTDVLSMLLLPSLGPSH
jgi:hypothetical protein